MSSRPMTLHRAYAAGLRSAGTSVDYDIALHRFITRHLSMPDASSYEHAWQNGWSDAPFNDHHALHCPLGIAYPQGHAECAR